MNDEQKPRPEPSTVGSALNDGLGACVWRDDSGGIWWASCNENKGAQPAFSFGDDGPDENGFNFCPYCGRKLIAVYA